MKTFGFDLETFLFQPGRPAPQLVCGSWADAEREWIGTADEAVAFFVESLTDGDHLAGVNIAFDVSVIAAYRPDLLPLIFKAGNAGQFHCCAVREALHDIAIDKLFKDYSTGKSFAKSEEMGGRYSMAILMQRHFSEDISAEKTGDVWRYKYAQLDGLPISAYPEAARLYPLKDARRSYDIWAAQEGHKNLHDEPAQVRAAIALALMCAWGLRTDGAYLEHVSREVDATWNAARAEFARAGIYRPDGTKDTAVLKRMVTAAYNGKPPTTPSGEVSTDRDTLEESGVDILIKLGTSGKNDKRKTQYIPALLQGVHIPLTPEFNVLVNTGRVSSNMQQLPQKGGIREAIVARPGTVILSCDYGGLELRTMAQRAILDPDVKFSKMADYINSGKDVHTYAASVFLGCTYDELIPRVKAKEPQAVAYRALAKVFNFGKGGGMGAGAMAYNARTKDGVRFCMLSGRATECGREKQSIKVQGKIKSVCSLCIQVAKELGEKWLRAWPEQGILFAKASRLTAGNRKVDSITFGSNRIRGGCGYTQWLNSPFQGAGGDGCKAAMWEIAERCYTRRDSATWGCRTILNVHDELLIEVPWVRRHDASFYIAKLMVQVMDAITPDAKNEVTPAIMRRLFKAASDVYDKAGILKPWWPGPSVWTYAPDSEVMAADLAR